MKWKISTNKLTETINVGRTIFSMLNSFMFNVCYVDTDYTSQRSTVKCQILNSCKIKILFKLIGFNYNLMLSKCTQTFIQINFTNPILLSTHQT